MRQAITDLIREFNLSRVSGQIEASIKDSVVLKTHEAKDSQIPIGQSKLGGLPDLPPTLEWPTWKNTPLAFIAQLNLRELPKADFLNMLPASGILSFFYSARQETAGFDPTDKGSWRVLYSAAADLARRKFPSDLPDEGKYKACSLEFRLSVTVPSWDSISVQAIHLSDEEDDSYREFSTQVSKATDTEGCVHRLLGHPDEIQSEMQYECQLVSNGLYCGDLANFQDPRVRTLRAGAPEWELLLQIDSDDDAAMMWGDVGRLYYWIRADDLKHGNWDKTWMIQQCC